MKRFQQHLTILALILLALAMAVPAFAAEGDPMTRPDPLPDWWYEHEVDAEFVKQHVVVPRDPEVAMIVDARPYMNKYAQGYIPTAYNVTPTQIDDMSGILPENKDALLIFYCGGYHCKLSHKAARAAEKLGYTNVKVYAAGFPDWKKNTNYDIGVESEYVKDLLAEGKKPYLLIDARPHNKFLKGHIPSSVNISDSKFDEMQGMLPADKSVQLIYYCGGFHCKLSHKSADKAKKLGYTDIVINESGYPGWKEKFGEAQAVAIQTDGDDGTMDIAQFEKLLKENPEAVRIVDVRDADEFAKGHFEGSESMPVDKVEEHIEEFTGEKPTVFVCSTGARSGECYYMFLDKRPDLDNVYYLEATIEFDKEGGYTIKPNK